MPAPEIKVATSARSVTSRALIEGPSAWIGADMRGREAQWTYRLSPPEIAEIVEPDLHTEARRIAAARPVRWRSKPDVRSSCLDPEHSGDTHSRLHLSDAPQICGEADRNALGRQFSLCASLRLLQFNNGWY
jgi:hypothetical protein